jgi:hypothetical protein
MAAAPTEAQIRELLQNSLNEIVPSLQQSIAKQYEAELLSLELTIKDQAARIEALKKGGKKSEKLAIVQE